MSVCSVCLFDLACCCCDRVEGDHVGGDVVPIDPTGTIPGLGGCLFTQWRAGIALDVALLNCKAGRRARAPLPDRGFT